MKQITALALVCVLLCSLFAGCVIVTPTLPVTDPRESTAAAVEIPETQHPKPTKATEEVPTEPDESDKIVGAWKYTISFNQVLDQIIEESGETDDRTADLMRRLYQDLTIAIVMEFKEDNTYTVTVDEADANEAAEQLKERLPELIPDLIAAMAGITLEELEAKLAEDGQTMDDLIAQFSNEFAAEEMIDDMVTVSEAGSFSYADGKLVMHGDDGTAVTYTVELSDSELKVVDIDVRTGSLPEGLLPLVFVRQR